MSGAGSGIPVTFDYAAIVTYRDGQRHSSEFDTDVAAARRRFRGR